MASYTELYLHTGGEIGYGASGFQYDISGPNAITRRLRLKNKPTFAELVHKIHVKLGLNRNDMVSRIIYKRPMFNGGSLCWTSVDVVDDDDIDAIYENLRRYEGYNLVELIIVIAEGDAGGNPGGSIHTHDNDYEMVNEGVHEENNEAPQQFGVNDVGPSQPRQSISRQDNEILSQFGGSEMQNIEVSRQQPSYSLERDRRPSEARNSSGRRDGNLLTRAASVGVRHDYQPTSISPIAVASSSQPRRSLSRRVGNFLSRSIFGTRSGSHSGERNFIQETGMERSRCIEQDNQRHSVSRTPHVRHRSSISHVPDVGRRSPVSQLQDINQRHSVSQISDITPGDLVGVRGYGNSANMVENDGTFLNPTSATVGNEPSISLSDDDDDAVFSLSHDYLSPNDDAEAEHANVFVESGSSESGDGDDSDNTQDVSPLASMHPSGDRSPVNFMFQSEHYTDMDFDASQVDVSEGVRYNTWDGCSELSTGLVFTCKDEVKSCVKKYSIMKNVDFRVIESKPNYWVVRCAQSDSGCRWRLRAIKKGVSPLWVITRFEGPHSCPGGNLSMDHRQLGSEIIRNCILGMVSKKPTLPVDVIIAAIKQQFNFDVSYTKAWYGKMKAIESIFGNYVESFERLPGFLIALQEYNAGSVYEFVLQETADANVKQFQRVFWSFKPAIDGFAHCKPILLIDGTFLTGKFQQTLLIASSVDGNDMLFPVAFAVVESENKSSWGWFMFMIRKHVTVRVGLTVISDRHAGIMSVFRDERSGWKEPLSFHRFCLRHFVSNYNTHHRNPTIKDLLYKAGAQFEKRMFKEKMDKIKDLDQDSYNWAMRISLDKWTLSEDGGYRYGHTTTNIAESVNSALKGVRMMPITAIVEHTFGRLVKYYEQRRGFYMTKMAQGLLFTPRCIEAMQEQANIARAHIVISYDSRFKLFSVIDRRAPDRNAAPDTYILSLERRECECGRFQGIKMPCSHAIAACMSRNLEMYQFVDKCYSITEALKCYDGHFRPMAHRAYWPHYNGPRIKPDMQLLRKKGRPRTSRIRNEMDTRERGNVTRCSKCGNVGHNKKTCRGAASSSSQYCRD